MHPRTLAARQCIQKLHGEACKIPPMASGINASEARVLELFSGKCILIRENDTPRERIFDDGSCRILQGKLCMDFVAPVEYSEIV